MAIYNTVMFFIERGSQIAALAEAVFNSIGSIAAGNVAGAANYVEQTIGRSLPVMISFLARLIGLGGISEHIKNVIKKIQTPIENAMNKLANFIVEKGKSLLGKGEGQNGKQAAADDRTLAQKQADVHKAAVEAEKIMEEKDASPDKVKAKLPPIQSKYKLTSIQLVKESGNKYHVEAKINPQKSTPPVELEGGGRKPASIKKIFFASHADKNKVKEEEVWYGDWLLRQLNSFEPGLLDKDVDKRNKTIGNIRGKDETWTIMQGAIYAPFIEDNRNAIQNLQGKLDDCAYLLSLERGGSFVADQIARGKNVPSEKIEKRLMSEEEARRLGTDKQNNHKVQQQADLKARIKSLMSGKENENITIAIAETLVGGGSTNGLIGTLEELLKEGLYPNLRFKLLLLKQTIHTEDEVEGVTLRKITRAEQIQTFISPTRYILGEDVGYQIDKSHEASKKPVIVFKGTQETLVAYQVTPNGETTARDIIIDLNAGAYAGLLPGIL
jgi:hypothetical protein